MRRWAVVLGMLVACGGSGDDRADIDGAPGGDGAATPDGPSVTTYSTSFDVDENPISEGGVWVHNANNPWQKVRTSGGRALAAQYTEVYDDAYAYLGNWAGGDDYEVIASVYFPSGNPGETEILLRVSDTDSQVRAYEFLYNTGGSWQLVRWNGPLGDFTYIHGGGGTGGSGGQVRATVIGPQIKTYWRQRATDPWNLLGEMTDATHATGKPGMSFYVHAAAGNIDGVGFEDYQVNAL